MVYTEWILSEEEPIEAILERFERGGLVSAMATPPRSMKPSSSQTEQMPRMRSHSQIIEESSPEPEEEVHSATDYIMP